MNDAIKSVILIILLAIVFGGTKTCESELFYIKEINVLGNNDMVKEAIISKFENIKNKPISFVDVKKLEEEIMKDIRVKEVYIDKMPPNKINITINERKAVAYTKIEDTFYVVDENLNIFSKIGENVDFSLPIIYYNDENKDILSKMLKNILTSNLYKITSEVLSVGDNYNIILNSGVKVITKEDVSTKKLDQAYIVYNKELELNNILEYIDIRFETINVK